jgi:hypothetical protein
MVRIDVICCNIVLVTQTLLCTEELPIRLAHRVKELEELPNNLSDMPSIIKVKNWYAQSFQVIEVSARHGG